MKIDKKIPLPPSFRTGYTAAIKALSIGDSFLSPNRACWSNAARQAKIRITARKQPGGQYRIWRTA